MDKLRLSITFFQQDFARYRGDSLGLHGINDTMSFSANQSLELFLIASRQYQLLTEGDIELNFEDENEERTMRLFSLTWSKAAGLSGKGGGLLKLINPDFPDPCLFAVTLGDSILPHSSYTPNLVSQS